MCWFQPLFQCCYFWTIYFFVCLGSIMTETILLWALPSCAPSHSHPLPVNLTHSHLLSPTPTHFSRNTTLSQPFFDKNDPLPPIFLRKTTHSHPFSQKQHTPTLISTITTHSHPFFKKKTHSHPFFDHNDTPLPIF